MKKKYSYSAVMESYKELIDERSEWEAEWRGISQYLLPGRGIYQRLTKPRKRKLTSPNIVNSIAEDALYVLTSGMHSALTSPSRPWFKLEWEDRRLEKVEQLKAWLQDAENKLHKALHASNFYSIINSFYIEYAGFGTGCIYVGEDGASDTAPFRFELLTAGEYAFSFGVGGRLNVFARSIFMTPRKLVERFPNTVSKKQAAEVAKNGAGIDKVTVTVLEYLLVSPYQDKNVTRIMYEVSAPDNANDQAFYKTEQEPLEISGFYEHPYSVGRWGTIGADEYGIGPGSRALPDIKRLQQMEKAFLMATHKAINPPLNAPSRLKGKLNTLPGGYNYYSNPNELVSSIYNHNFDYSGVGAAVERVEQRIQKCFYNDIFLTAARDPNASPLRTGQVQVQEQEKTLRLGPVVERLQHEFFEPTIERCFNIMLRRGLFEDLPADLAEMVSNYNINLVSPLATAQRASALQGINSFMGFLGQAAQFDQQILDNIDVDAAAREYADINGVQFGILRTQEQVAAIRKQRQQMIAQEKARQDALAQAQAQSQMNAEQAAASKTQAEAGQVLAETQQINQDIGYGI